MRKKISKEEFVEFSVTKRKYKTLLTHKYKNRKVWEKPNSNDILSYIPGAIVELCVKEGEFVEAGKTIIVLAAMKMLNNIKMPFSGKVKKIYVEKGMKIPKDFLMIEIEAKREK